MGAPHCKGHHWRFDEKIRHGLSLGSPHYERITAIHSRNQRRAQIFACRFQIVLISIQEMWWWSLIDSFQGVPKNHPPNFGSTLHSSFCHAPFITRNLKTHRTNGMVLLLVFGVLGVLEHMVSLKYGLFHSMYSSMVSYLSIYIYMYHIY